MDAVNRNKYLEMFAAFIRQWIQAYPARVGEFRARIASGLAMNNEEFDRWINVNRCLTNSNQTSADASKTSMQLSVNSTNEMCGGANSPDVTKPGSTGSVSASTSIQPSDAINPPLGRAAVRPIISNSVLTYHLEIGESDGAPGAEMDEEIRVEIQLLIDAKNAARNGVLEKDDGAKLRRLLKVNGCKLGSTIRRKAIDELRADVQAAMNGWPYRLTVGALVRKKSSERGGGFELISKSERFNALLQEYGDVKFKEKSDSAGSNFITRNEVFNSFMRCEEVPEFLAVEKVPFEPPIEKHLIDWKPPAGYEPDGSHFVKFCEFFDNIPEYPHKALFAAAALTVLWGGTPARQYGLRPVMAFEAGQVGSGKSTAVELISQWTTDYVTLDLDKRSEERLRTRLLSGNEELTSRILWLDNVKTYLDSGFLEGFVTQQWISGEVKFAGEGRRPNTFTMFVAGNNLRISTDFARRFFFIHFEKQEKLGNWERDVGVFVKENKHKILADALFILRQPVGPVDWSRNPGETNRSWCESVLARVCAFPGLRGLTGGIRVEDVIYINQEKRGTADLEVEEAGAIREGIMERLCAWRNWYWRGATDTRLPMRPNGDPFDPVIRAQTPPISAASEVWDGTAEGFAFSSNRSEVTENNMLAWMSQILSNQKRVLSAALVARIVDKHINAKRIDWLEPVHRECGSCYLIRRNAIEAWLRERHERAQNSVVGGPGNE